MKCGLLPISYDALAVGTVSYHDYQGVLNDATERQSIVDDLGPTNKVPTFRVSLPSSLLTPRSRPTQPSHWALCIE